MSRRFLAVDCHINGSAIKQFGAWIALLISLSAGSAHAVFIDFDDITRVPVDGCFCDHPLSTEYLSKGLLIDGGYLSGETNPDGTNNNHLLASDYLHLIFVGTLPTFVSMQVDAFYDQAVFLTFFGTDGLIATHQTHGWAGSDELSTPYVPNQHVAFEHSQGISSIGISAFYGMRTGAIIDNLTFTVSRSVPEPSAALLLAIALFTVWMRQRRKISR